MTKLPKALTDNKRLGVLSQGQARRLISGGVVHVNGERVTDIDREVTDGDKVEIKTKRKK